jgi:hypothetical protein
LSLDKQEKIEADAVKAEKKAEKKAELEQKKKEVRSQTFHICRPQRIPADTIGCKGTLSAPVASECNG